MIALLFPGQGSQRPGVIRDLARQSKDARTLFERASEILNVDVFTNDDEAALTRTEAAQIHLFVTGVASANLLREAGLEIDMVAGHSVGAFGAAHATGMLAFEDALRLVAMRGRAMADDFAGGYAMGAITGLDENVVRSLIEAECAPGDGGALAAVYLSAINAADQVTIAGRKDSVERVLGVATQHGARSARRLAVGVPSHTPYMLPVRDCLRAAIAMVTIGVPAIPYAGNCDGRAKMRADDIARDLYEGVAAPVRWRDATQMLYERGARVFVEVYPGDVLTNLAAFAFPESSAISSERIGIDATVRLARRASAGSA